MIRVPTARIIVLLLVIDAVSMLLLNSTADDMNNNLEVNARRTVKKKKQGRSTSSSSGDIRDDKSSAVSSSSLELSSSESSSSKQKKKKYPKPKSSSERKGWRKWHRKCTPCPDDMRLKWRDPSIKWICGGYQRARRSFKSLCMMHYRNCQDGTMFVKIHDHRCANDTGREERPHGDHFFYDYKVHLRDDTSKSDMSSSSEDAASSSFDS